MRCPEIKHIKAALMHVQGPRTSNKDTTSAPPTVRMTQKITTVRIYCLFFVEPNGRFLDNPL